MKMILPMMLHNCIKIFLPLLGQMSSFCLSDCLLNSSPIINSHLVKYSKRFEASQCFCFTAQDWNLAKQHKISFRLGKSLIVVIPVLLLILHSILMWAEQEAGNYTKLFRLRLRSQLKEHQGDLRGWGAGWWVQYRTPSLGGIRHMAEPGWLLN